MGASNPVNGFRRKSLTRVVSGWRSYKAYAEKPKNAETKTPKNPKKSA
jgi:hypothetical protein